MFRILICAVLACSALHVFAADMKDSEVERMTLQASPEADTAEYKEAINSLVTRCELIRNNWIPALTDFMTDETDSVTRLGALYIALQLVTNNDKLPPDVVTYYGECTKVVIQAYQMNAARFTTKQHKM